MNTTDQQSAPDVLSPIEALNSLASGKAAGAIKVEASAQELGQHFVKLAAAVTAGRIQTLRITDDQPLPMARADFLANARICAIALQAVHPRPIQLQLS
jgi:phosphoribosyl-dephospho-CoA transferase